MRIYNNIPAIAALNSFTRTTHEVAKSLRKLSTGLRVNSAADDAAGLAISEKMRSQIRGLDMAARNAQDGISMIQTAQGALQETGSILHRMRELAVQSANDALTSNDRSFIQLEIEQLKQELDRIASTTQFNKKKLLDGSSDVLWSTSDIGMYAIVKGRIKKEDEGNYKISVQTLATGNAEIKKSNIFEAYTEPMVIDGRVIGMGYSVLNINMTQTQRINNINPGVQGAPVPNAQGVYPTAYAGSGGSCGHTFMYATPVGNVLPGRYTYRFPDRPYPQGDARNDLPVIRNISSYGMGINDIILDDSDPHTMFSDFSTIPNTNIVFEAVAINHIEESVTFKVTSRRFDINGNTLPDIESFITISERGISGGVLNSGVVQIHAEGSYSVGVFSALGIDIMPDKIRLNKDYNLFNIGDSFHLNITPPLGNINAPASGVIPAGARTFLGIAGPDSIELFYVMDSSACRDKQVDIPFLKIDSATGDIYNAIFRSEFTSIPYPHNLGNPLNRFFDLLADGTSEIRNVDINTSMEIVYDFERKYNTFGDLFKNMDYPQTLTLHQRELSTTVVIYESDTFFDFVSKLNYAIAFGLDNARYLNNTINEFAVLAGGKESTPEAVGLFVPIDNGFTWTYNSTIVIRSAIPGVDGIIHFSGEEEFLRAFGLNVIQEAQEPIFNISVSNAHDGTSITSGVKISGNIAHGVVNENIDMVFDPMRNIKVFWNETAKRFDFRIKETRTDEYLHIASNSTILQIGANEKEDMAVSFGDISCRSLGLSNLLLLDNKLSARAISKIDVAIDKVSSIRSKLGAFENRLEHTITNLTVASENLTSSESRIRDVDMAKEMLKFTKLMILVNSGNSMLSQANQLPNEVLTLLR